MDPQNTQGQLRRVHKTHIKHPTSWAARTWRGPEGQGTTNPVYRPSVSVLPVQGTLHSRPKALGSLVDQPGGRTTYLCSIIDGGVWVKRGRGGGVISSPLSPPTLHMFSHGAVRTSWCLELRHLFRGLKFACVISCTILKKSRLMTNGQILVIKIQFALRLFCFQF